MAGEHTAEPWEAKFSAGAGWEIRALLPEGFKFDGTCRGADGSTWFQTWTLASPQMVLVSCERWVQFETEQWKAMQEANANRIVACVNALAGVPSPQPDSVVKLVMAARRVLDDLHDDTVTMCSDLSTPEQVGRCIKDIESMRAGLRAALADFAEVQP